MAGPARGSIHLHLRRRADSPDVVHYLVQQGIHAVGTAGEQHVLASGEFTLARGASLVEDLRHVLDTLARLL